MEGIFVTTPLPRGKFAFSRGEPLLRRKLAYGQSDKPDATHV